MAIRKLKVLPSGVSGDHWEFHGVLVNSDYSGVSMRAILYQNQAAFLSGASALHQTEIELVANNNPVHSKALKSLCENKLITLAGDFLSGTIVQP